MLFHFGLVNRILEWMDIVSIYGIETVVFSHVSWLDISLYYANILVLNSKPMPTIKYQTQYKKDYRALFFVLPYSDADRECLDAEQCSSYTKIVIKMETIIMLPN